MSQSGQSETSTMKYSPIVCAAGHSERIEDNLQDGGCSRDAHDYACRFNQPPANPMIPQTIDDLEALPGLGSVTPAIRKLVADLKPGQAPPHMVLTGPPGTGKTIVGHVLGDIYRSLGMLRTGNLVNTDRFGLVTGFLGQTPAKTLEKCRSALDAILFIDEAYMLDASDASEYPGRDRRYNREKLDASFGREAIDTLLKFMDDHHGRIVVILAGDRTETQRFLVRNPAVASRFTKIIDFPAYSPQELCDVFRMLSGRQEFLLPTGFESRLMLWIEKNRGDPYWANARNMRTLLERLREAQAERLGKPNSDRVLEISDFDAVLGST
jgi:stage V sporulation protein K